MRNEARRDRLRRSFSFDAKEPKNQVRPDRSPAMAGQAARPDWPVPPQV